LSAVSIRAVRRFLALFLLLLLPLQFSWAAVEAYCAHEERLEAAQAGRHAQHADADAAAAASDVGATSDTGCDSCHCHGHCTGILSSVRAIEPHPSGARPSATLADTDGAHAPARPERPQWAPLA
jgi:hypothetical protein